MSAPRLVSFVLLAVGLLSGLALVARPFVAQMEATAWIMGLLFAGCTLFGLMLCAFGPRRAQAMRLSGGALLCQGLFSVVGLFLDGTGFVPAIRPTLALWLMAPAALGGGLLLNHFAGALERLEATPR